MKSDEGESKEEAEAGVKERSSWQIE